MSAEGAAGTAKRTKLPRTVKALAAVSLLTDASSEMIYPLLPAFLTATLGVGAAWVGVIEGAADAVASLLKLASGWWSDRMPRRKPLVVFGYGLASVLRPLVAFASAGWQVLAIRVGDRVGKGIRGAPRDAMIADAVPANERGRAFGVQRAADHAGAFIGPLIAFVLLQWVGVSVRTVFLLAAIPGAIAVLVAVFGVREDVSRRLPADDPANPVVRLVDHIVAEGILTRASEIHLAPEESCVAVWYRIDGELRRVMALPPNAGPPLTARIKGMASLDVAERERTQDGRAHVTVKGARVDVRVATIPGPLGEKTVISILGRGPIAGDASASDAAVPAAAPPLGAPFWRYLAVLVLFTLGNSTDAFLLLRASQLGVSAATIPLLWAALHVVKSATSIPAGAWSDRVGRRTMIAAGWLWYALVYLGFALASSMWHAWALFIAYGLFFGLTEAVERALVADLVPAARRGTAFGWYNGVIGAAVLPASVVFGLLWDWRGSAFAFTVGAAAAAVASVALVAVRPPRERTA